MSFTPKQQIMLVTPVLLPLSMYVIFQALVGRFGSPFGYYGAMFVYWIVWCLVLPIYILGWRGVLDLFREGKPRFGTPLGNRWYYFGCL